MAIDTTVGGPAAEAYISVTDADTYFSLRGNTAWAALTTPAKEAALRLSTDYMAGAYKWCGERTTDTQALDWPRTGTQYDDDVIPEAVKRANAELAVRASAGSLLADQGAQVKSETVGPISVTYADGARQSVRYAAVDASLRAAGVLCVGYGQIPVVRA